VDKLTRNVLPAHPPNLAIMIFLLPHATARFHAGDVQSFYLSGTSAISCGNHYKTLLYQRE
jgi:hypothetical protein